MTVLLTVLFKIKLQESSKKAGLSLIFDPLRGPIFLFTYCYHLRLTHTDGHGWLRVCRGSALPCRIRKSAPSGDRGWRRHAQLD